MKGTPRLRRILHVDLDPFFVSVERRLDPSLRGVPVIVGGGDGSAGVVAAASVEAQAVGVRPGQAVSRAHQLCPQAAFRPGDLESYARFSKDVTSILLAVSRRVERLSTDEAFVDLTPDPPHLTNPVAAAETIKDDIQRRLGLDASLGLASTRLAARVASTWAKPGGLLIVLPGYEQSFLARQPVTFLRDLPAHVEAALKKAGLETLGQVADAEESALAAAVGTTAAPRLRAAARAEDEEAVAVSAPPAWVQEEAAIRHRGSDRSALETVVGGLVARGYRRLRPFGLLAGAMTVEVLRGQRSGKRSQVFEPGLIDEETAQGVARTLAEQLLEPPGDVRAIQVRLTRLASPHAQVPLFPQAPGIPRRRA